MQKFESVASASGVADVERFDDDQVSAGCQKAGPGIWRKPGSRVRHTSSGLTPGQLRPGSWRQRCTDRERQSMAM